MPFKDSRGQVAELFLSPLPVVKEFDVFRDLPHSLLPGFVLPMINVFGLPRAPETFHGRVVVAVALAAHRGAHPEAVQQTPERTGAVLAAALRMMQQSMRRPLRKLFIKNMVRQNQQCFNKRIIEAILDIRKVVFIIWYIFHHFSPM